MKKLSFLIIGLLLVMGLFGQTDAVAITFDFRDYTNPNGAASFKTFGNETSWWDTTNTLDIKIYGYIINDATSLTAALDHTNATINQWTTGLGVDDELKTDMKGINQVEFLSFKAPAGYYIDAITISGLTNIEWAWIRSNPAPGGVLQSLVDPTALTTPYPVTGTDTLSGWGEDTFSLIFTDDYVLVGPYLSEITSDPDTVFRVAQITVAPVPEPATMFLLGSGLIGVGVFVRRKFKK